MQPQGSQSGALSQNRKITRVGILGLALGLVSLAAAALTPWIIDLLEPEEPPSDEVVVDIAIRLKERMTAKLKGEEFVPAPPSEGSNLVKAYSGGVVVGGLIAIGIGVAGLVLQHDRRLNTAAIAVGGSAIVFQYVLLLAAVIIAVLLIGLIVSALSFADVA